MPIIMPIKDLRNTTEISNIAHGAEAVDAEIVFAELEKKYSTVASRA